MLDKEKLIMSKMLNISEAATIALHTTALLADDPEKMLSVKDIVNKITVSPAHLSKVLQRLGKVGLVKSLRGPKGGFLLAKDPHEITLLDVYESIDGPMTSSACLLDSPICNGKCILDTVLEDVNKEVFRILKNTRLSDLSGIYK